MFALKVNKPEAESDDWSTFCHYCEKWFENDRWSFRDDIYEDQGQEFRIYSGDPSNSDYDTGFSVSNEIDCHECPNCYSVVRELNSGSEHASDDDSDTWLCGSCGGAFYNQPNAQMCCSSFEGAKPDPLVFARAQSGG